MRLLTFRRGGSSIVLAMIVLTILCCTAVGINQYLARQMLINDYLADRFLAQAMVEVTGVQNNNLNCGKVRTVSENKWIVTLRSGRQVKVSK